MSEAREIGKAIKKVAKKNQIPMSWKVFQGEVTITFDRQDDQAIQKILSTMGFWGEGEYCREEGKRSLMIFGSGKANVVSVENLSWNEVL